MRKDETLHNKIHRERHKIRRKLVADKYLWTRNLLLEKENRDLGGSR